MSLGRLILRRLILGLAFLGHELSPGLKLAPAPISIDLLYNNFFQEFMRNFIKKV